MENESVIKKKKRLKRKKRILVVLEVLAAIAIIFALLVVFVPSIKNRVVSAVSQTALGRNIIKYYGKETYDNNVYDVEFDEKKIKKNNIEYNYSTEYTNFIIFGVDTRESELDAYTHSDSNLIVSIHNTTGEVKIVSIYRDTYLRVMCNDDTYVYDKVNAGYFKGGPEGAINTINTNLDLDLTDYVSVNFAGVAKIIDCLGGIEVNLTKDELAQLNYHLLGTALATGDYATKVENYGENISLNGVQATTYCRIRKATYYDPETGDAISNDFGRAARQRAVIMKLVEKAKGASVSELTDMLNVVLESNYEGNPIVKTSFTLDEMIDMIPIIFNFKLAGSQGFPRKLTTGYIGETSYVFAKGLSKNVSLLHEFLFGEENYEPTYDVEEIDSDLVYKTGVTEDTSDDDTDDTIRKADGALGDIYESDEPNINLNKNFDYDDGGNSEYMR